MALLIFLSGGPKCGLAADVADFTALAQSFPSDVQPLLKRYCHECHAGDRTEGEVNLRSFATFAAVRKNPRVWQKVGEMLDGGQMPPKDSDQPTDDERARLRRWTHDYLLREAAASAGDPGPVVLRRLSNAEYTYTLRDSTGVAALDPAREFPVDGAAGEGFTNTGSALVMSPALVTKYLDAAKEVANHAVLLPDGLRFSPYTSQRDWTDERLAAIRAFYAQFTESGGGMAVNLQGVKFDTNGGGRLPLEKYLAATLAERESLTAGKKSVADVARESGLNAKYLGNLWAVLNDRRPSLLLDAVRNQWRSAKPDDAPALVATINAWQKSLWRFATVGHIGKLNGPKGWQLPVAPLAQKTEMKLKLAAPDGAADVAVYLATSDAGDGNEHDFVVWLRPRLVAAGRPEILLRDAGDLARTMLARRGRMLPQTAKYLAAADELLAAAGQTKLADVAEKHRLETAALQAWLEYLGYGFGEAVQVTQPLNEKFNSSGGYDFIKGWRIKDFPSLLANSSDQTVRIPGRMKPNSVAVHPSPKLNAAVGWRSPVAGKMRVEATVAPAHFECGNGIEWSFELRRGAMRRQLGKGVVQGNKVVQVGPLEHLAVQTGDLISLLIGPREGNHSCDLTDVEITIQSDDTDGPRWSLAHDISSDVLAGNPHADSLGHADVWNFYAEPVSDGAAAPGIPADSLLARWQGAESAEAKTKLADDVQQLLTSSPPTAKESPDALVYRQLTSLGGPLLAGARNTKVDKTLPGERTAKTDWGIDPAHFGKHPDGGAIDADSLCVQAPAILEVRLPAELAAGYELVATGLLDPRTGREGSAQVQLLATKPSAAPGLTPGAWTTQAGARLWSDGLPAATTDAPILVSDGSAARQRIEAAFDDFRHLFPISLCYTKIVPTDEVVTLTLYFREDDQLRRLMLDDVQSADLDRLWAELNFVSHHPLKQVDAFEQLYQFATQDADPKAFEPLREPIAQRAAAFRAELTAAEPQQLNRAIEFASRAWRRPLTATEKDDLRAFYRQLRRQELPHEAALRATLARVLVAPAFLYKLEKPAAVDKQGPVNDWELAARLSYFLWSSVPDAELSAVAAAGKLHDDNALVEQMRRMLRDARVRRLASEFASQWLHIHDFDQLDEKSERAFPTFAGLRGAMYEESLLFFTDLVQTDGSLLNLLDADYTFLNEELAKHYGIPGVQGPQWRRVDGVKKFNRGGILTQAATLAKQSGASRTSPILRGNWISEVLLGERLPRPPKNVPQLAETPPAGLTERQLIQRHSSDPACAKCHARIDPLGFSLENFDAIGRYRQKDAAGLTIDAQTALADGTALDGVAGLQNYLLHARREVFIRQFCRKLLGYALGRGVQLSDEPLLAEMQSSLQAHGYKVDTAIELIVRSRQFREIRGEAFEEN